MFNYTDNMSLQTYTEAKMLNIYSTNRPKVFFPIRQEIFSYLQFIIGLWAIVPNDLVTIQKKATKPVSL